MFRSIRLKNFKSYKDSGEVPFAPLTILIGANNSGKSTILQAMLMLKQTLEDASPSTALVTSGRQVDLSGFHDILHGKRTTGEQSFEVSLSIVDEAGWTRSQAIAPSGRQVRVPQSDRFNAVFSFQPRVGEIRVRRSTLWSGDNVMMDVRDGGRSWSSQVLPKQLPSGVKPGFRYFLPILGFENVRLPYPEIEQFVTVGDIQSYYWFRRFAGLSRIGPLRTRTPWYSGVGTRSASEFGFGGDNLLAALGNREKVRGPNRTLAELVDEWMSKGFKILEKVHLESLDRAGIVRMLQGDEFNGTKDINVAAMGEGISQVLPIVARALAGDPWECLLIEQPEIHLHPSLQAELADLFIHTVQGARRQVIVETHSEHLLLRLRRRIAESARADKPEIRPEDVAILYVEKDGSESRVRRLELNGKGHFADWPKGFFEEAYQEAMALAMASRRPE